MRIIREQRIFSRTAVAMAAVCVLLLQTMVAGLATGVSISGADSGLLRLVCSSSAAASGDVSNNDKQAPVTHHAGACCILHNEATIEPDASVASIASPRPISPSVVSLPTTAADAIHDSPELAALSARAPPVRVG